MSWIGAYTKIVRRNVKTDDAVAKLTKIMRDNDIAFFVFKGQMVASYYPSPEMRWTFTFSGRIGQGLNSYWKRMSR